MIGKHGSRSGMLPNADLAFRYVCPAERYVYLVSLNYGLTGCWRESADGQNASISLPGHKTCTIVHYGPLILAYRRRAVEVDPP